MFAPIFPGNSQLDQMYKICRVLGTPTQKSWSDGFKLAAKIGFNFPHYEGIPLNQLMPNASFEAIDLLNELLQYDPKKRPTSNQILQHPYFSSMNINQPIISNKINNNNVSNNNNENKTKEKKKHYDELEDWSDDEEELFETHINPNEKNTPKVFNIISNFYILF